MIELLANSRRRYVLQYLLNNEHGNAEKIASEIAPREEGDIREIQISLVHNHLPRLADHGLLEYDHRSGDFVRSTGFEDIRTIVEEIEAKSSVPV